jgi:Na+-translocating ferredoxin:NAD+ oxidoreductase RnfG subunit
LFFVVNQVQAFISSLTPEQIEEQQQEVLKHVQEEAIKNKLSEQEVREFSDTVEKSRCSEVCSRGSNQE